MQFGSAEKKESKRNERGCKRGDKRSDTDTDGEMGLKPKLTGGFPVQHVDWGVKASPVS